MIAASQYDTLNRCIVSMAARTIGTVTSWMENRVNASTSAKAWECERGSGRDLRVA